MSVLCPCPERPKGNRGDDLWRKEERGEERGEKEEKESRGRRENDMHERQNEQGKRWLCHSL